MDPAKIAKERRKCAGYSPVIHSLSQDKDQGQAKHQDHDKLQDWEKHQEKERYMVVNMLSINTEKQIPIVETRSEERN